VLSATRLEISSDNDPGILVYSVYQLNVLNLKHIIRITYDSWRILSVVLVKNKK
jgi:hypothetical protein